MKKFKVHLRSGKSSNILYDTPIHAIKAHGASNILKIEEVVSKEKVFSSKLKSDTVLEISARGLDDLQLSHKVGYTATYNRPSEDKIVSGMVMLETSHDYVLESNLDYVSSYDKEIHKEWVGPGYRPEKEWEWVIYHKNSKILTRDEALKKYGKFAGIQGGIGYIEVKK
jgi:hypothetical protein